MLLVRASVVAGSASACPWYMAASSSPQAVPQRSSTNTGLPGQHTQGQLARLPIGQPHAAATRLTHHPLPLPQVRLANLRGAFRLARGLIVGFGGPETSRPPPRRQLALLQELAAALDHVQQDLSGCHVLLGGHTGTDSSGTMWLDPEDPDAWVDFLDGVDVGFVLSRRATVKALRQLEQSVAASVGLAQVFTAPAGQVHTGYRAFLEQLAGHGAHAGPVAGGELAALSLQVVPPSQVPGQGPVSHWAGCSVNVGQGCLLVPVDCPAADVYSYVASQGPAVLAAVEAEQAGAAEIQQLATHARTILRLRHLVRGDSVQPQQFKQCCRGLLANSQELLPLLEGLSICVSDRNGLLLDKGMLLLAWDFKL
jgi:hypothetical protein